MDEALEREIRNTRGTVLGDGAWRLIALRLGRDPKDPALSETRAAIVEVVRSTLCVMEESGFEGLDEWLRLERESIEDGLDFGTGSGIGSEGTREEERT